jgi:hypothetical protein
MDQSNLQTATVAQGLNENSQEIEKQGHNPTITSCYYHQRFLSFFLFFFIIIIIFVVNVSEKM